MEPHYIVIALFNAFEKSDSKGTFDKQLFGYSKRDTLMARFINDCKDDQTCQRIIIIKDTTGECEQSTREQW